MPHKLITAAFPQDNYYQQVIMPINTIKPNRGVYLHMLEEHIQSLLDKAADYHEKQLDKMRVELKKEVKKVFSGLLTDVKELKSAVKELRKKNVTTHLVSDEAEEIKQKLIERGVKIHG